MVLFPEGGFLRKRLEVSQRYAAKNNLPILKNVTLPRVGALKAITEILPPHNSIGNNNAAAKRTENGTVRPFGSQGIAEYLIDIFNMNLILTVLSLTIQFTSNLFVCFFLLLISFQ